MHRKISCDEEDKKLSFNVIVAKLNTAQKNSKKYANHLLLDDSHKGITMIKFVGIRLKFVGIKKELLALKIAYNPASKVAVGFEVLLLVPSLAIKKAVG